MARLRTRLAAAGAAIGLAAPLALAGPAFAGVDMDNPVSGVSACEDGEHTIIWTLTNTTGELVDIDSATLSGGAVGTAQFTPNPVDPDGTATAFTSVSGDTEGTVTIEVTTSWVEGEFPFDALSTAEVELEACVEPTTTTTSTSTTTTTAPSTTTTTVKAAAAVVVATPKFTG